MIKVAALTSGKNVPSARFRIRQNIGSLRKMGIDVAEYPASIGKNVRLPGVLGRVRQRYVAPLAAGLIAAKFAMRLPGVILSRQADVVWFNRELVTGFKSFEDFINKPILFDVDDAIWLNRSFVKKIAQKADVVIAGNFYLAEWFQKYCQNIYIVPTAIDTSRFKPSIDIEKRDEFIIGWTGSSDNFRYLYDIEKPLYKFLCDHRNAIISIICDKPPKFNLIPEDRIQFIRWSRENEAVILRGFDLGLMPLRDTDWERGKCSFKMLQYMATGIPVCVSPVGMNGEILNAANVGFSPQSEEEWYGAIKAIYDNPDLGLKLGKEGRLHVKKFFSVEVISRKLASIIKEMV